MRHLLAALAILMVLAAPASAQQTATLVADAIRIGQDGTLVAEGHVEVLFGQTRLRASRISYSRTGDQLQIDGPIVVVDGTGQLLLADSAELSRDLRDGVLRSARLVLNQQLQLAAAQIDRVGGRYTQLSRTVASSCQVCAAHPVPIWEIRAARVVHDAQEHQLYFDQAQFRVAGVPVFYLPRLRMPDPTLDRATGFLMPEIRSNSRLGQGIKLPYFIVIGDSRDLLLTPYVSTNATRTLEARYRQAFASGTLQFDGAVTRDTLLPGITRSYLTGTGQFGLAGGYDLRFNLAAVSDRAYMLEYGYGQTDLLRSNLELTRTQRQSYISVQLSRFTSLRAGQISGNEPSLVGDASIHRRFTPEILGGEGGFQLQTYGLRRSSEVDVLGRDTARISAKFDWRRNWQLPAGISAAALAAITQDFYAIRQDANYPHGLGRTTPVAAIELRWPWVRAGSKGATQVIEPIVQLVYSPSSGRAVPNEDSLLVEFDEGNLFDLNRFSGADVTERGLRSNLGVSWTRYDPDGWQANATLGRVVRARDLGQFSTGSGLAGKKSDWLAALQLQTSNGLALTNRALFGQDLSFAKDELRLDLATRRLNLSTSYLWLVADPTEGRSANTSEWLVDAAYDLGAQWNGRANLRYDTITNRATSAALGLRFANECVTLDLSVSRRFTSSAKVTPATDFGLSVELFGFGGGAKTGAVSKSCRG